LTLPWKQSAERLLTISRSEIRGILRLAATLLDIVVICACTRVRTRKIANKAILLFIILLTIMIC
jgi:hypothetical protein